MDEKIRELLSEEIANEVKDLATLNPGSNEHSAAVDSLTKLYKLRIEETKVDLEFEEKCKRRMMEDSQHAQENDQISRQEKERYIRFGLEVAGLILPLVFYAHWMRKGFEFEETGTFTSATFKGLFNRFRPTKK